MKQFRRVDNILGWLSFLIAAFVYCSTIEPTASFWDCPEFITTGYKLEVGHPPGAPFFMLTANLFSQFASDPSQVAYMVNTMSALFSALTIMFLFWTVSHLTRRLLVKDWSELTTGKLIAIEASGLVGALIYTFTDTFWFSAVEGEVYAYSSLFTAVVFWLMLKWEDHADEPHSDRWLVLIMYMTGLSIGVHLLNLLCVPALVLVYYYRRFPHKNPKADLRGSLGALAVSVVILAAVLYGVVPGIVQVGGWFELFFVNTLGCPFNTGEIIYIILLIACIIWAIRETYTNRNEKRGNIAFLLSVGMLGIPFYGHGWPAVIIGVIVLALLWMVLNMRGKKKGLMISARVKNTSLLCMLMLMIGYSSYALIVIRSSANPPMDQNSPEDIFTLGQYLSREQYGSRPLFYGKAYTSQVKLEKDGEYCRPAVKKGAPVYQRKEKASENEKDSYFVVRTNDEYEYAQNMFFPRMYSDNDQHRNAYESWMGGVKGTNVPYDRCGEMIMVKVPSQMENLRFFLSYQCNFMYWRYFMWNFAGRQNDIQGNGELEHGNWITGFSWFDNWRLGDQSKLPDDLKDNKGHNVFYCLPLLLGLIGLFWQSLRKGPNGIRQFWVVFFLFFMTGLAIVIYLNQTPMQPRERDYAYAGSFYAFAIWCGMGVAAIIDEICRKMKGHEASIAATVGAVCLLVPIQMASQTWDDHDRSGRYTCRDFGQNYLMSLQQEGNPIIFTNGDNDTFPLWYNQDVEGVRTDARVCNLSYLQTDWYIDQMRRPAYDSPSVPISWSRLEYCAGTNDYVQVNPSLKEEIKNIYKEYPEEAAKLFGENPFELKNILKYWVRGDVNETQREIINQLTNGNGHVIPTDTVYMTIDKEAVKKSGMMMAADSIPDQMTISLEGKRALYKGDLMMLEIIAQSNWTRPVYVALTVGPSNYMNLGDNFIQEGLAWRISPFTTNAPGAKNFDTKRTYDNLMKRFKFGGIDKEGIYLDETVMRMCYTHRRVFVQLAMQLANEGQNGKAAEVLAYVDKNVPSYNVPIDFESGSLDEARVYSAIGDKAKAMEIVKQLWKRSEQYLNWYLSLDGIRFAGSQRECMLHFHVLQNAAMLGSANDKAWGEKKMTELESLINAYHAKGGSFGE
ncbi:protein O-mannosyl-transferase family [Xylanibacter rodentium]|uniref:protein O-mannosyl-transferase family n=2 Tax=Xylanibacter rodentium TaxID=2736289 RepID=UPI00155592B1|nr:DUF2723 domain-containing protein [Xylanibacter rodentium]NPE11425.1 DUF2723 domain-containing protein [Prevotella sp. PJ1A]NPE38812.1 DUF2723 domain-containing protein [Prevotella sp. PCJ2]